MGRRGNSSYSDVDVSIVNLFFDLNDLNEEYERIVSTSEVIAMKKEWYGFISEMCKRFIKEASKGHLESSKAFELFQSSYNFEAFNNLINAHLKSLFFNAVDEVLSISKENLKKEINYKVMLHEFFVKDLIEPVIKFAGTGLYFQFVDSMLEKKWVNEVLAEILIEINKRAFNND